MGSEGFQFAAQLGGGFAAGAGGLLCLFLVGLCLGEAFTDLLEFSGAAFLLGLVLLLEVGGVGFGLGQFGIEAGSFGAAGFQGFGTGGGLERSNRPATNFIPASRNLFPGRHVQYRLSR